MSDSTTPTDPNLASLIHFVDRPDLLADHTMSSVEWEAVEVLMPRILRGKSKEDVKQLLLAEIDGMSKKRLMAVLAGETLEESSSSEEEEEEILEEVVEEMMDELEGTGEENEQSSSSKQTTEEASVKASEESDEKKEEPVKEVSPEPMDHQIEGENNGGEASEEGELHDDASDRSMTPPDPSPSVPARKSEEVDSDDDDFDRQLDRDLEDVI